MPDKIETHIGTLELFDGFPNEETMQKAYDFLLFQRGVDEDPDRAKGGDAPERLK